jgi:DNA-binding CsgD family transcriptional regulator
MPGPLTEPLSGSEIRVLRYLPTNLTGPEIARELSVSPNTVKTHIRSLYAKLGTHGRAVAVEHARALGLLAPSAGVGDTSNPRTAAHRQGSRRAVLGRRRPQLDMLEQHHDGGPAACLDGSRLTSTSSRPSAAPSTSTP